MKKIIIAIIAIIATVMCLSCFVGCADDDKIIVVGYTLYEPMNYEDEDGELVGFDTELATAVFEDLGYEVIFKEIQWGNKYMDLESGAIDCIWNGFTSNGVETDEDGKETARGDLVDFTYDYMINQQVVVVSADVVDDVKDATYFDGKKGFAEAGSAGLAFANDTLKGSNVSESVAQVDAITEVKAKSAEFAVVDLQLAKSIVGKGDYADLAIVETVEGAAEYYAVGFSKDSELTALVNEVFEKFAEDGTLETIAKKYGVENSIVTDFGEEK